MPTILLLKSCPFCASDDLRVEHLGSEARPFFVVGCAHCEAEGPISKTAIGARKAWNHRPAPFDGLTA